MNSPILLHIPHASTRIPEAYKRDFTADLTGEVQAMTDWYTDELFDYPAEKLIFPVSRLVCDVERFRDPRREEMSRCGMGACYTHGSGGTRIRTLSPGREEQILRALYDPHHAAFEKKTAEKLARWGQCLIIDCHSFSAAPLAYEADQTSDRPDVCIGADPFHTPPAMTEKLAVIFSKMGYRVAVNTPYAGAIVPAAYYQRNAAVRSVMIEVNRGLYLDREFQRMPAIDRVKREIALGIDALKRC